MRALFLLLVLPSSLAQATGNLVYYNGKPYNEQNGKPQHFTGEVSYVDMETKKVSSREQHVDGEREGPYTSYDITTGKVLDHGSYHHGKYHGARQHFGNDGKIEEEYAYSNGELKGIQKSYRDGILSRVYLMDGVNSTPDTELYFTPKGQLSQLHCGKRPIGKQDAQWCGHNGKQSTVQLYSDEGKVRATEQYLWGRAHGTFTRFNVKTGKVMSEDRYVNGKSEKDGARNYDREGGLLSKTDCDEKRTSCTETTFFKGGKEVQTETVYKGGQLAKRTERYQNGKVSEEVVADGKQFRISRSDDEGNLVSKGTYVSGQDWYWDLYMPDGVVEHFRKGKVWRRERYQAGHREGLSELYWDVDDKHVRQDSTYVKDHVTGQKFYVNDKLVLELLFMPDGSLKSRVEHNVPKGIEI